MPVSYSPAKQHVVIRFQNWKNKRMGSPNRPWSRLDEESLIRDAKRRAKWDDFGSDEFLEPLRVLLKAADEAENLTFVGKCATHGGLVNTLATRLRMEQAVQLHPEILDQPVKRPLIIVGAPRTGTTLLNNLLSQDPASRPLLGWEARHPAPHRPDQKRGTSPRRILRKCAVNEWFFNRLMPGLREVHPFAYNLPDECHWLCFPAFLFPPAMVIPSMKEWMDEQPDSYYENAYQLYRRALQILEWQRPAPGHWVLKSPLHLWALDALMNAVPEASFIQTHRTLDEVLPSFSSLAGMLMSIFTDRIESEAVGEATLDFTRDLVSRFTQARTQTDPARILDLRYTDLVADPIASVRLVYERFGYDYTPEFEQRLQAFLADRKNTKPSSHSYSPEQFGLDRDEILREFESYHQAYGLV